MTEYDYWKIFPRMPRKVTLGDITVRDGFQHLEKFISTRAKIFYAEEMIFAGCRNIEVTNLGNPYLMPQFSDAEQVLAHLRSDRFKATLQKAGSQRGRHHHHCGYHPGAGRWTGPSSWPKRASGRTAA
jgi:hydroxymethylglutaryl-CoA lyase